MVKAVKKAVSKLNQHCRVIGADSNENCISGYFVDGFWKIPRIDDLDITTLINYCYHHDVRYIIPTRDGELTFFASHKQILREQGISVMVSEINAIEICLDKFQFFHRNVISGFPVIRAATQIDGITSSLYVVKERYGAGSQSVGLRLNKEEAQKHARSLQEPIFQPYISGREVSVDLYLDKKGKTKGAVSRTRELVVNGESQITTSFKNQELETLCASLAEKMCLYGHVVFQVIIDEEKKFHIVECNSRFGGASTLSIEMGLDSFYWFLLESNGTDLDSIPFQRSVVEKKQIRYAEDLIIEW